MDAQRGIARRMVIGVPDEGLTSVWERDFSAYPPAGVILFRRHFADLEGLRRLTTRLRELARPRRIFIAIDEEGGWVSQLDGHLVVPPNAALLARGARGDDLFETHRVTGMRLRALGIDWVYAPVADVNVEPRNPVIGARSFGTDAATVTAALEPVLAGLRAGGVATCLKHFPGHGATTVDSHLALPVADADRATLEAREIAPFRAHRAASSVMTAHVVYRAIDPDRPGTFSRAVVTGLLREQLGFGGVAITDALEMKGAAEGREPYDAARLALEAGCDLLLFAFHSENVRRTRLELAKALVDGRIEHAAFDAARPRLAEFDRAHAEPSAGDLARPLAELTPPGWRERIDGIIERGLVVRGALAAPAGPWHITEPEFARGASLRALLERNGIPVTDDLAQAVARVVAVSSRVPLTASATEELRAGARSKPTALVGLQNDAFLDDVPEAALRISAADATEPTREGVARRFVKELRGSA